MITIRNYTDDDYQGVKALLQEADLFASTWDSQENLKGMVLKDPESVLVAVDGNVIVGNIFITPFGTKVAHVYRLVVKKEYRKKGIASQLIKTAEGIIKKKGGVEIGLYVDTQNSELKEFYKKKNFKTSNKEFIHIWKELY